MDSDSVYFVKESMLAELEGGNVWIEIRSGNTAFHFEMPVSVFLATFANFAGIARQWRGGECEVVALEIVREH